MDRADAHPSKADESIDLPSGHAAAIIRRNPVREQRLADTRKVHCCFARNLRGQQQVHIGGADWSAREGAIHLAASVKGPT